MSCIEYYISISTFRDSEEYENILWSAVTKLKNMKAPNLITLIYSYLLSHERYHNVKYVLNRTKKSPLFLRMF